MFGAELEKLTQVSFVSYGKTELQTSLLVVGVFQNSDIIGVVNTINQNANGVISRMLERFEAKMGQHLFINSEEIINAGYSGIMLLGLGKSSEYSQHDSEYIGRVVYESLKNLMYKVVYVVINQTDNVDHLLAFSRGIQLASYCFDKYLTKKKTRHVDEVCIIVEDPDLLKQEYEALVKPVNSGVILCSNLAMEPPNVLNPAYYADFLDTLSRDYDGLSVKIKTEKQIRALGMNAFLGVGQGSVNPPRLVAIEWNGNPDVDGNDYVLVGKGVTFDTGGISLKPARKMWDMKYDMCGSGAIAGTMLALAESKAPVNVVAVLALVENSISGSAQRPSDIITSMSGQTIEVLNTDAEGRLALADALTFAQENYVSEDTRLIDMATLTGAVCVALGNQYAGLFSNDEKFVKDLLKASNRTNERLWQFPMTKEYDKLIKSDFADMQNISTLGTGGDSIVAAKFLEKFIKSGVLWAHLDIASVAYDYDDRNYPKKVASAFGVRLLYTLVRNL
ncbi:MAG: putative cytosol aminopeptidase [Candidatus Xenolissoclinum pacificiensis L6]|uniref:Probable cytosol aminopeptidase n=1 Tax=Candidatus Xenolissoclinum pacificiensis L6 TaxID=1401685 RepID=W2V0V0_9RICK|nr:MAG: putative cytosol aminopeptidase [Candidatus Xenolissoclinum pacificiensis L6]